MNLAIGHRSPLLNASQRMDWSRDCLPLGPNGSSEEAAVVTEPSRFAFERRAPNLKKNLDDPRMTIG